jgi:hypothetical protein
MHESRKGRGAYRRASAPPFPAAVVSRGIGRLLCRGAQRRAEVELYLSSIDSGLITEGTNNDQVDYGISNCHAAA